MNSQFTGESNGRVGNLGKHTNVLTPKKSTRISIIKYTFAQVKSTGFIWTNKNVSQLICWSFSNFKWDSVSQINLFDTWQCCRSIAFLSFDSADPRIGGGNRPLPPQSPRAPIQTSAPFYSGRSSAASPSHLHAGRVINYGQREISTISQLTQNPERPMQFRLRSAALAPAADSLQLPA